MKRMLINATHTDEIRVAIADGQKLYDLDIDSAGHYRKKGNIYKAKITRVEPSLEACFVNYGSERHGFLPYKEISAAYCKQAPKGKPRLPINEALKEGDEIIVQVNKEERGNKGAALSTYISLAGRYLVYMPGNQRAGGISRQIRGEKRSHLQDIMRRLEIPKNDGVIIRTAGLGRTFEELQWDFNYLQQVWQAIQTTAKQKKGPFFIYQESDLFIRALRDYLQPDIGEILIDDRESYEKAREFMQQVMPHNLKKLSYYNDNTPLFSRYQIERQIQSAFEREVKLPSGGSLVIDQTEALLSIDINSAKATKGIDVETTALNTNLEAADEIARQLKIRDLGGLVVIDFIDMRNNKNQRQVENRMRDAADSDRARVQIGKISKFGLLEMSRQRLRSSISDSSQITCPTCGGHGFIRSMESLVISIIRLTEEEMIKPKTGRVIIQAPVDTTNKILNEKRTELSELETRHGVQVSVISNDNLSFPDFHVQRLNTNESHVSIDSIKLVKPEDCHKPVSLDPPSPTQESPALGMVKPDVQAPKRSIALVVSSWFKSLFAKPNKKSKGKASNKKPYHKNSRANTKGQQIKRTQAKKHQPNKAIKPNQQKHASKQGNQNNQQQAQNKGQQQKKQTNKGQKNQQQAGGKNNQQANKGTNQANNQPNKQAKNVNNRSKKGGKSIYGNKNKNKNNVSPEVPKNETDTNTVKKMTRPLGSVADLAAKKDPVVPSGALKKRPIDSINVDNKKPIDGKNPAKQSQSDQQNDDLKSKSNTSQNKGQKPQGKKPESQKPESQKPESKKPESQKPESQKPESQKPESKKPESQKPESQKPESQKPESKKPESQKPESQKPESQKPESKKPESKKPESQKPESQKPESKKPESKKPESKKPESKKPESQKPESQKPESQKPESQKPESKKPESQKPESKKPESKKPESKKPESKKPASKKPDSNEAQGKQKANAIPKSSITAEMIKPGIYKAKKSD